MEAADIAIAYIEKNHAIDSRLRVNSLMFFGSGPKLGWTTIITTKALKIELLRYARNLAKSNTEKVELE